MRGRDVLYLPDILRGRNIIEKIEFKKQSLKELIIELEDTDWEKDKLLKKYRGLLDDYKLNQLLTILKNSRKEDWIKIIKKNILDLYGNEISNKYVCIYLVGYCANLCLENSLDDTLNKFLIDKGEKYTYYKIKKIIDSGINDGVYLGILNSNGSIKDEIFFRNWIYKEEDETLNSVFHSYKRKLGNEEYNEKVKPLYNNRYYIKKQIEKENIEVEFPYITRKKIKQNEKIRTVYSIQEYSLTEITIKYLKRRLDEVFNIKYSDRNKIVRTVLNLIDNINALDDYTIYRFDIQDFFNSVNTKIIIENYILDSRLNKYEKNLLKKLSNNYSYCFAGLPTSNALIEIAGKKFDEMIQVNLKNNGMIFYSRYVDDGLIILNKKVAKEHIEEQLKIALKVCFNDNIKLNTGKVKYLIKEEKKESFSYLGYKFERTINCNFVFGIDKEKIDKYKNKINKIIKMYLINNDAELLRQRLNFFISRVVFYNNDNSRYSNIGNWDVVGLSSNYSLLRKYIKERKLTRDTERFLKSAIIIEANKETHSKLPYFLKGCGKNYYSLEYGIRKNKSIVFHPNIGWSQEHLENMIVRLGYPGNLSKKAYRECVKIYCGLIKL